MRILLLGNNGQLGWELHRTLATAGELITLDQPVIDFLKPEKLSELIINISPTIIVNAVAYTAVDAAEYDPQLAFIINTSTPGKIAQTAQITNSILVHFSTDYIFDGDTSQPYIETDQAKPQSTYGISKLEGEKAICATDCNYIIIRTSWMYSNRCDNFYKNILKWSRSKKEMRIVTDQIGSPTSARLLAEITSQMLIVCKNNLNEELNFPRGIYHLGGSGHTSRYDFAQYILKNDPHKSQQIVQSVVPVSSLEFPSGAHRPAFSALNCDKFFHTFGLKLPPWTDGVKLALEETAQFS